MARKGFQPKRTPHPAHPKTRSTLRTIINGRSSCIIFKMNPVAICPTITAFGTHDYRAQMEMLEPFAERIHIDLMDGVFAPHISPGLDQIWWPDSITADLHLMYQ